MYFTEELASLRLFESLLWNQGIQVQVFDFAQMLAFSRLFQASADVRSTGDNVPVSYETFVVTSPIWFVISALVVLIGVAGAFIRMSVYSYLWTFATIYFLAG